jgi:hypothetical protein
MAAPQRLCAFSRIASNTGPGSPGERLMASNTYDGEHFRAVATHGYPEEYAAMQRIAQNTGGRGLPRCVEFVQRGGARALGDLAPANPSAASKRRCGVLTKSHRNMLARTAISD